MKKLKYLFFFIFFLLIFCSKVNAKIYPVENNGTLWKDQWTNKTLPGFLIDTTISQNLNGFEFNLETGFTTDSYGSQVKEYLYAGNYLFDFTIIADNLDMSRMNNCRSWSSDFRFLDITTGNLIGAKASISSTCVNTFYTKVNGKNALKLLFRFNITNQSYTYMTEQLKFIIYQGAYAIVPSDGTKTFQVGIGNIQDYDSAIVDAFNNEANTNTQINQNQTIIDQNQQQINQNQTIINKQDQINGSINNSNVDDPSGKFNQFESYLPENGVITQLITLPISLFQRVLSSINGTCTQYNLGNLLGTDLILPCINISNYIGTTLWSVIDVLFSGFFVLVIGKKMIKAFNNFTSMEEGDILD